nr:sporulation protein YjcZ [Evansella clarkii]
MGGHHLPPPPVWHGYGAPAYGGYRAPGYGWGAGFVIAIVVVLFILFILVGAARLTPR